MDRHTEGWTDGAGEYAYRMAKQLKEDVDRHRIARTWQIVPVLSLSNMLRMDLSGDGVSSPLRCEPAKRRRIRSSRPDGWRSRRIQKWGRRRCDGACFAPKISSYLLTLETRTVFVIDAASAPTPTGMGTWRCKRTKWRRDLSPSDSGPVGRGPRLKNSWSPD